MNILENELVRKYFMRQDLRTPTHHMAVAILNAMQQPIRRGDLYLSALVQFQQGCQVQTWTYDSEWDGFHPMALRLPDAFQKPESTSRKCGCGLTWSTIHRFDGPCYVVDKIANPWDTMASQFEKPDK